MSLSRRNFLGHSTSLFLGAAFMNSLIATGCKGSNSYGDAVPTTPQNPQSGAGDCSSGLRKVVYQNPGHAHSAINIPKEMVDTAQPGFYVLLSGSHDHDFELTAADFVKLKNGETITKTETVHGHRIQISCS